MTEVEFLEDLNALISESIEARDDPAETLKGVASEVRDRIALLEADRHEMDRLRTENERLKAALRLVVSADDQPDSPNRRDYQRDVASGVARDLLAELQRREQ